MAKQKTIDNHKNVLNTVRSYLKEYPDYPITKACNDLKINLSKYYNALKWEKEQKEKQEQTKPSEKKSHIISIEITNDNFLHLVNTQNKYLIDYKQYLQMRVNEMLSKERDD
jgi:uncharacterized membrane protein YcgQ (UPF0703/DUF1980 family)